MYIMEDGIAQRIDEITEGATKLLVPKGSMTDEVPPRDVAFYNPKAKNNRDISIAAYLAFLENFEGPKTMLEALSGIGARGLRVANETDAQVHHVYLNDINYNAIEIAKRTATMNGLRSVTFTNSEACRFLSDHAAKGTRGAIVDIDPFGSPAPYFDCAIRATMHRGLLSSTATDLQVLNGLFNDACQNIYGGVPIRGVTYGNEIAIRLVLGCLRSVAARLGVSIHPVLVTAEMHYYRIYSYIMVKHTKSANEEIGYAIHCERCGSRALIRYKTAKCNDCDESDVKIAGPLWIGSLFDEAFVKDTSQHLSHLLKDTTNSSMLKYMYKVIKESQVNTGLYYTVDEMASRIKTSPPRFAHVIEQLQKNGFKASATSLSYTGFRTDAPLDIIKDVFS